MRWLKRLWIKRRYTLLLSLILLILVTVFLGTKAYLYIYLLLGNDVIIKLDADKEAIFLKHGEEINLAFDAEVTTNPFCEASCWASFTDIGKNYLIEKNTFILKPGLGFKKEFKVKAKEGIGQDLYRFDLECYSPGSFLCHTDNRPTTRSVLITVNTDLNDYEIKNRERFNEELTVLGNKISEIQANSIVAKNYLNKLNESAIVDFDALLKIENETEEIYTNLSEIGNNSEVINLEDYFLKMEEIENSSIMLNETATEMVNEYNLLIDEINSSRERLVELNKAPDDKVLTIIDVFNEAVTLINMRNSLEEKKLMAEKVKSELGNYSSSNLTVNFVKQIFEINIEKIELRELFKESVELKLEDIKSECCVFGECENCCIEDKCKNENYPVVLLHGHAVNKDLTFEYSLETFKTLQKKLEEDGYLSAGTITLYTKQDVPERIWGEINAPLTIRSSYYFDIFETPENYVLVQKKSENIDTYAIRMKELIDNVKYRTGKEKVNIIAFSMGGLVARRYIQVFGEDSVNKLILIGTPNKGIVGDVAAICPVVGEKRECDDMNADSVFMNKLNNGKFPKIPVYMVVGSGCSMAGGDGDGIVLTENAKLDRAVNFAVNGTCSGKFSPLHLDLLNVEMYPEVYGFVKRSLEE